MGPRIDSVAFLRWMESGSIAGSSMRLASINEELYPARSDPLGIAFSFPLRDNMKPFAPLVGLLGCRISHLPCRLSLKLGPFYSDRSAERLRNRFQSGFLRRNQPFLRHRSFLLPKSSRWFPCLTDAAGQFILFADQWYRNALTFPAPAERRWKGTTTIARDDQAIPLRKTTRGLVLGLSSTAGFFHPKLINCTESF